MIYRTQYHYPWRWAIIAEFFWRVEHLPLSCERQIFAPIARWGYRMRKASERSGYHSNTPNLDGWCVAICPGCGTQVAEWLDEDGGPGHIEHELCPMCDEVNRMEELDGF